MKTVLALLFAALLLPAHVTAQEAVLPCDATDLAVAGDGSGVWFSCSRYLAAMKRAETAGRPVPPYVGTSNDPTDMYWLPTGTKTPVRIASAKGRINVIAAPLGSKALIVMPQERGWGQVFLYKGQQRVKELPVDAYFLLWSADTRSLYFYGGSTVEADAWNILGIYDLNTGTLARKTLREPTEIVRVCPATGHLYSVTPPYPGFAGSTVEYTSTAQFVSRIRGWIGARFSAQCRYVASESDYHGPLPWSIYDVSTGNRMFRYAGVDEQDKSDVYSLIQWNPKNESVLLREYVPKHGGRPALQIFDVRTGRVLETLRDMGLVRWSAEGDRVILVRGKALEWRSVTVSSGR